MARKKKIEFEAALKELESLVQKLEHGELSLEDSLNAFEQGITLVRDCQSTLNEAEQRVQQVMEADQQIVKTPFTPEV